MWPLFPRIPIYPRQRYHSYLKGLSLSVPRITQGRCVVTLEVEQFDYTQPPTGQYKGSFPAGASRTLRMVLEPGSAGPIVPFGGPSYVGRYYDAGVDKGSVSIKWVSKFLRRAVLEIDTVTGAVAPQPVPRLSGTGTEYFDTVFATFAVEGYDRFDHVVDLEAGRHACTFTVRLTGKPGTEIAGQRLTLRNCNVFRFQGDLIEDILIYYANPGD